jgi:hypothetical protein
MLFKQPNLKNLLQLFNTVKPAIQIFFLNRLVADLQNPNTNAIQDASTEFCAGRTVR